MTASRLIITRCRQAGARVEVLGRRQNEPACAERLLFWKAGLLRRYSADSAVIEDGAGLEEEWGPDGESRDFGADLVEELRQGDPRAIRAALFVAAVLLLAWLLGIPVA